MTELLYDSDNPDSIPSGVNAAGYCDGYAAKAWNERGWARFPNAWRIAVSAFTNDGNVLDVETGDATPNQAPSWVTERRKAGVDPIVYVQQSRWGEVQAAFHQQGVAGPHYWIANYDNVAVIPAGAIAKQYADQAIIPGNPHYDLSVVQSSLFGGGGGIITAPWRQVKSVATADTYIMFGIGDTDSIFYMRWDGTKWVQGSLNGQASDFTVTASGQRIDVYGRGLDRQAYHWYSSDGGATFSAYESLGGQWKSPLQAVGPAPANSGGSEPAEPTKITLSIPSVPGTATGTIT